MNDRKKMRHINRNYSEPGHYCVTICTQDREPWFGTIKNGIMTLNECGVIVDNQWRWLATNFDNVRIDEFCVMPDHFHGILQILGDGHDVDRRDVVRHDVVRRDVGNGRDHSLRTCGHIEYTKKIKPLPELIGAFKTTSSKKIHQSGATGFRWQKSFYDHVVRDGNDHARLRRYIAENALNWVKDEGNP